MAEDEKAWVVTMETDWSKCFDSNLSPEASLHQEVDKQLAEVGVLSDVVKRGRMTRGTQRTAEMEIQIPYDVMAGLVVTFPDSPLVKRAKEIGSEETVSDLEAALWEVYNGMIADAVEDARSAGAVMTCEEKGLDAVVRYISEVAFDLEWPESDDFEWEEPESWMELFSKQLKEKKVTVREIRSHIP